LTESDGPALSDRYLDLLKGTLTRHLFVDEEVWDVGTSLKGWEPTSGYKQRVQGRVRGGLAKRGLRLVHTGADAGDRFEGLDWPANAETMVGIRRLDNVQHCIEMLLADAVPGDLIETGVWRGGCSIFMRAVLAAHGCTDRTVWLADSFEGLAPPDAEQYPQEFDVDLSTFDTLAVGLDQVRQNFRRYGLLDDQVRFLPGWFKDTLPDAPIERLSLLRLDGDYYESTMTALTYLYPKVSPGGFVIVDDYQIPACKAAVNDFLEGVSEQPTMVRIDDSSVYWRR